MPDTLILIFLLGLTSTFVMGILFLISILGVLAGADYTDKEIAKGAGKIGLYLLPVNIIFCIYLFI